MINILNRLFPRAGSRTRRAPARRRAVPCRPRLECLEDRSLLSAPAVTGITLQIQGLQGEPPGGLRADSAHLGQTFFVGGTPRSDPLDVILPLDSSAPALQKAAAEGTFFPGARLTVSSAGQPLPITLDFHSVIISSFKILNGQISPRVEIDLVFDQPRQQMPPITDITLALQRFQTTPPGGLHLDSIHMGGTFAVGLQPRPDPFQAVMTLDANAVALQRAVLLGTIFPTGRLTLDTGAGQTATFAFTEVALTSFQIVDGPTGLPKVKFSFIALPS